MTNGITDKELIRLALTDYAKRNGLKVVTKGQKQGEFNINLASGNITRKAKALYKQGVYNDWQRLQKQLALNYDVTRNIKAKDFTSSEIERVDKTIKLSGFVAKYSNNVYGKELKDVYERYTQGKATDKELTEAINNVRYNSADYAEGHYLSQSEVEEYYEKLI